MNPGLAAVILLGLVAIATAAGFLWRARTGRAVSVHDDTVVTEADVDAPASFGSRATLLQFSSEFCAGCPSTRRLLGTIADRSDGVAHVDVDLTHRADLANKYRILQTPTTLVLDGNGVVRARIGGLPRTTAIIDALTPLIGSPDVISR